MKIKEGDFLELDFTGRLKVNGQVFDTTSEIIAKEAGLEYKDKKLKPITIIVGKHHILPALEDFLVGKECGKTYTVELKAEQAFGKKIPQLIQSIPLRVFKENGLNPYVGMEVVLDNNTYGVVKRVGSGRVIVDMNHPLAGQDLIYELKPIRIIDDLKEKAEKLAEIMLLPLSKIELKDDVLEFKLKLDSPLGKENEDKLIEEIAKLLNHDKGKIKISYESKKAGQEKINK